MPPGINNINKVLEVINYKKSLSQKLQQKVINMRKPAKTNDAKSEFQISNV